MESLTHIVKSSSNVISLLNASGKILCVSGETAEMFGYLPREIVGRNPLELIHPDDRAHARRALRMIVARSLGPCQVEMRMQRKEGGWCWAECTISNLLSESAVGAIIVQCRDLNNDGREWQRSLREAGESEWAKSLKSLRSSKDKTALEESVRADARLEDFANAVAHDLQEPLRTISMLTEMSVREAGLDEKRKFQAQLIEEAVQRMGSFLEGLRAFAMSGFDEHDTDLDLEGVVKEVRLNLGHAIAASKAAVTVGPLPFVQGNEKHLLRVVQNLIANAIKYRGAAPVEIHVSARERVGAWEIRVKDNGPGIARKHHKQIFGLFKRLHGREIPGAGIGLAICAKIIEGMGGAIWVESEVGSGSTFCFTLPAVSRADPALTRAAGAGAIPAAQSHPELVASGPVRDQQRQGNKES
jgi:PAS domain S-box-containing protein